MNTQKTHIHIYKKEVYFKYKPRKSNFKHSLEKMKFNYRVCFGTKKYLFRNLIITLDNYIPQSYLPKNKLIPRSIGSLKKN